jgi:hypothetical protein
VQNNGLLAVSFTTSSSYASLGDPHTDSWETKMARRASLTVEGLEERALLSSLAYSLTTDQLVYPIGQPIELTFTETNTGDQPLTVEVSPTDFSVSQYNAVIWQSNPANAGQSPTSETLLPGQSRSQTASWDGTETYASPSIGDSSQSSQVNAFGTFVVSNPCAPEGLTATFQITDPIVSTVTTDQSVYQLGEPVQMTYTEVNTSDQSITIPRAQPSGFGITHNGTSVLIDLLPAIFIFGTETIAPGQVFTMSQAWNGIPMSGPSAPGDLTGTFVVDYGPGANDTVATTTFQIVAPSSDDLVTSVTTDQTTYQAGQPVNMTFTETNVGDQPIAVLTGSTEFEITQNGTAIFGGIINPGGPMILEPTWLTLQPGQSYSQTATWNGIPADYPAGPVISLAATFTVSNAFDPNADTATFQYAAPPTSVLQTSVTTDQSVYQLGQPIQLTFTETNVGTTPVQVWEGPSSFNVTQNGAEVWNSLVPDLYPYIWDLGNYSWATLQPGQSYTQTATWNGVPDQLPSGDPSGTFTVSNEEDPHADTATFQIVSPSANALTSTITTDKAVYDFEEPAQITFTATNTGSQPVVVLTGPTAFLITTNRTQVWASTGAQDMSSSTSWQTLQPGQSYSQTTTWSGVDGFAMDSPEGTGTFVVSDVLDPNGSSATIQILPTPYETPSDPPAPNPTPPDLPPSNPPPSNPSAQPPNGPSVPPIAATLSTAPTYKLGQSVPLSLILKDVSASEVAINESRHIETVTVQHGSTVVYESARKVRPLTSRVIRSGHPFKLTTLWSGKPNQAGVKKLAPGAYTITVDDDGYAASTTVDLLKRNRL